MRNPIAATVVFAFLTGTAVQAQDQAQNGSGGAAPETSTVSGSAAPASPAPVIDGTLNDEAWAAAEILTDFVQREPAEGRPASQPTEVRVVYDEQAIYIGAWLFDSDTSAIVVGETRRDASLDNTDAFLVILDTFLDAQNGFVFGTTPAGIEYDGQVTNEGQGGQGNPGRGRNQQTGSGGGFNLN